MTNENVNVTKGFNATESKMLFQGLRTQIMQRAYISKNIIDVLVELGVRDDVVKKALKRAFDDVIGTNETFLKLIKTYDTTSTFKDCY